ncbi:hypothetical protein A4X13_0g4086 [Tilletia indica]|uniref:Uncharacterized protein n=1 Tax=Tilletia indica TaxID=43049 RepID=A0A177TUU8_9BASI|nr:hypothetical protein A4X13_0g4086 [Tilletia indica]
MKGARQLTIFKTLTQTSSCSSLFINTLSCFRRKQVHSMKQSFTATCETSRYHTTRSFHDSRWPTVQVFRTSGATLLSRHWTSSLRPQESSTSTARMHISRECMHIASHRPPTHPPMTDFTLLPSLLAWTRTSDGRDQPATPCHNRHNTLSRYASVCFQSGQAFFGSSLNKLTKIQAVQAQLPAKFTLPRMRKLPIAHTQSIMYSYIHPRRCNTSYKVDTGPYTRQDGNATVGNPRNAATAPRHSAHARPLLSVHRSSRLVSSFPRSSSPSHTISIGHLFTYTRADKWTHRTGLKMLMRHSRPTHTHAHNAQPQHGHHTSPT